MTQHVNFSMGNNFYLELRYLASSSLDFKHKLNVKWFGFSIWQSKNICFCLSKRKVHSQKTDINTYINVLKRLFMRSGDSKTNISTGISNLIFLRPLYFLYT